MILIVTRACDGCTARVAALRADGVEVDVVALAGAIWTRSHCRRCQPEPPADPMTRTEEMHDAERGAAYRNPQGLRRPIRGRHPARPTFLDRMIVKRPQ